MGAREAKTGDDLVLVAARPAATSTRVKRRGRKDTAVRIEQLHEREIPKGTAGVMRRYPISCSNRSPRCIHMWLASIRLDGCGV